MTIPDKTMNEKTDTERSAQEPANPEILNPLLFLLAARRGVRNDARFAETAVSDDYIMRYQGKSGVEAISTRPLWKRIIFFLGILPAKFMIVFCMFNLGYTATDMIDHKPASEDPEYNRSRLWSRTRIGAYTALLTTFLLLAAKRYAKCLAAAATPPQYDPTTYQYRLTSALDQRGIEYREIVAATPDDMTRYWKEQQALCERFRIVGLVDPEQANHVYDIVVRFYNNGGIYMQFPAADTTTSRPVLAMSANESS
ncbi:uncharacterized protein LDX57_012728 [Aspergillus melleus]|uniref:uncharacterized protein n=1 Tax=Aspergillus melleus TaxID=138277 RepID=UPI001E8D13F4|nr:uncharacterized protein LDX57_012728 [Aspergillus melleus]KAH8435099.1 hypothetical protein LDX57_012728 [Aspergillus melleus]